MELRTISSTGTVIFCTGTEGAESADSRSLLICSPISAKLCLMVVIYFELIFKGGSAALNAVRNTVLLNLLFISCGTIFALTLSLSFNEISNKYIKKITQSFSFLPYFISTVVVGIFVTGLLGFENGVINRIITSFGGEKVAFYMEAK